MEHIGIRYSWAHEEKEDGAVRLTFERRGD
jgi:hypothetical protein